MPNIKDIRTQNDLMAALAVALEERDEEAFEDMAALIHDWLIDSETAQALAAVIEAAATAVCLLNDRN